MDGGFTRNIDEVIRNINNAEIISIMFPVLGKSLVLDVRYTADEGPMAVVVPMVGSPEERSRSIQRMRPGFPRPKELALVPWTLYVDSLVRLGIWDSIMKRFIESGHGEAIKACERALDELRRLEREEITSAIRGDNYQTIWSREG